mmetsp:Transcript_83842/g.237792  ORF Transcript_83842/g.237792 Transcript_83842/m.237792 type:complete len:434 (+) Transcript_83842:63-1364(+)
MRRSGLLGGDRPARDPGGRLRPTRHGAAQKGVGAEPRHQLRPVVHGVDAELGRQLWLACLPRPLLPLASVSVAPLVPSRPPLPGRATLPPWLLLLRNDARAAPLPAPALAVAADPLGDADRRPVAEVAVAGPAPAVLAGVTAVLALHVVGGGRLLRPWHPWPAGAAQPPGRGCTGGNDHNSDDASDDPPDDASAVAASAALLPGGHLDRRRGGAVRGGGGGGPGRGGGELRLDDRAVPGADVAAALAPLVQLLLDHVRDVVVGDVRGLVVEIDRLLRGLDDDPVGDVDPHHLQAPQRATGGGDRHRDLDAARGAEDLRDAPLQRPLRPPASHELLGVLHLQPQRAPHHYQRNRGHRRGDRRRGRHGLRTPTGRVHAAQGCRGSVVLVGPPGADRGDEGDRGDAEGEHPGTERHHGHSSSKNPGGARHPRTVNS